MPSFALQAVNVQGIRVTIPYFEAKVIAFLDVPKCFAFFAIMTQVSVARYPLSSLKVKTLFCFRNTTICHLCQNIASRFADKFKAGQVEADDVLFL